MFFKQDHRLSNSPDIDNKLKDNLYFKMKRAAEISLYGGSIHYQLLGQNGLQRITDAFEVLDQQGNKQPVKDIISEIRKSFHSLQQTDTYPQNNRAITELRNICHDLYLLSSAIFPVVFKLPTRYATADQLKDSLYFLMKQAAEVSLYGGSIHYQLLGQNGLQRIADAFVSLDKHDDKQPVLDIISEIKADFKSLVLTNTYSKNERAINGLRDICVGLDVLSPAIFPAANLGCQ